MHRCSIIWHLWHSYVHRCSIIWYLALAILCMQVFQINHAVPNYISLSLTNPGVRIKGPRPSSPPPSKSPILSFTPTPTPNRQDESYVMLLVRRKGGGDKETLKIKWLRNAKIGTCGSVIPLPDSYQLSFSLCSSVLKGSSMDCWPLVGLRLNPTIFF